MNSQVQQIIVYEHSLGEITVITAYCTYTVHDMYFNVHSTFTET